MRLRPEEARALKEAKSRMWGGYHIGDVSRELRSMVEIVDRLKKLPSDRQLKTAMKAAIKQLKKDCVRDGCTCAMNTLQIAIGSDS